MKGHFRKSGDCFIYIYIHYLKSSIFSRYELNYFDIFNRKINFNIQPCLICLTEGPPKYTET